MGRMQIAIRQIKLTPIFLVSQFAKFLTRQYFHLYGIAMFLHQYKMFFCIPIYWNLDNNLYPKWHHMQKLSDTVEEEAFA